MAKCLYCGNAKPNHFICEVCGDGMCDECYDADTEHWEHAERPYEDEEWTKEQQAKFGEPDYICYKCLEK